MKNTVQFIADRYDLLESILWLSHISIPIFGVGVLFWLVLRRGKIRWLVALGLVGVSVFMYARYIERYWIAVNYVKMDRDWSTRVVLIADQHLGVYKDAAYMEGIVGNINDLENVDFVVIAGDFTYWPVDLDLEHHALSDLQVPVYAVLGNHDVSQSGFITHQDELQELLPKLGVKLLHNDIATTTSGVTIYGLGNHWSHTDDVSLLKHADPETENILILTHNPDTTDQEYPKVDLSDSVTMTGHTHCGQIRIPFLYKYAIPTEGDFPDQGPYDLGDKGTLLITCGLGEVGLPLRLFNRPEILVVDL